MEGWEKGTDRSQIKQTGHLEWGGVLSFLLGAYHYGHAHCPDKTLVIVLRLLDRPASTGLHLLV